MGDFCGPEMRVGESVATGPNLGVVATEILPEEEAVCAEGFEGREGLVSCGLFVRGLAAMAGVDADLLEPERASGRFGEDSRELKGEEREVDVCVAEGWLFESG